ncbi:MAG: Gfo/Idh/MocA family oxidoreductase, partial [Candidatus Latescibacteria bacterium]|nr:Gfo/Idh/MocA family oxidoreductase [Candidatus Latescibacterota bacterium]MCK5526360.1 Gfo/Idh/MocA family oxidoreductase [Candidatus Latescibacterota bacterium]
MKDGKLGYGIVGCGVIGPWHAESVKRCADAELVAVCDIDEEKGLAFAEKFGGVAFHKDYKELVAREDVDVISVCTPSGAHAEVMIAAAEAGVHVLCEKPIEIELDQIDAMIRAAKDHHIKLGCIFQRRTYEVSKKVREAVMRGDLGKMVLADAYLKYYRSQEYYNSAGWRGTWALDGGGALMNQGVHGVDLLLWLMGDDPVVSVYAKADHLVRDIEVEDTSVALITFESGAYGVIEGTTSVNPGEETKIMLHGKLGTINLDEGKIGRWATTTGEDDRAEEQEIEVEEQKGGGTADPTAISIAGHIDLVKDMVAAIKEDREPMVSGESARKSVALILAIYESAKTGKEVRL